MDTSTAVSPYYTTATNNFSFALYRVKTLITTRLFFILLFRVFFSHRLGRGWSVLWSRSIEPSDQTRLVQTCRRRFRVKLVFFFFWNLLVRTKYNKIISNSYFSKVLFVFRTFTRRHLHCFFFTHKTPTQF